MEAGEGEGDRRGGGGGGGGGGVKVAVVDSDLEGSDDDSDDRAAREDYAEFVMAEGSWNEGFTFAPPTPLAIDYRSNSQVPEEDALAHELEEYIHIYIYIYMYIYI